MGKTVELIEKDKTYLGTKNNEAIRSYFHNSGLCVCRPASGQKIISMSGCLGSVGVQVEPIS